MNTNMSHDNEAQIILDALREIQDNPELSSEAEHNPDSILDRLGLSGVARHAVALGIAGLLMIPVGATPVPVWWNA